MTHYRDFIDPYNPDYGFKPTEWVETAKRRLQGYRVDWEFQDTESGFLVALTKQPLYLKREDFERLGVVQTGLRHNGGGPQFYIILGPVQPKPALERVWMVSNPSISAEEFFTDDALMTGGVWNEEDALAQFCDPEGHTIDSLVSIIVGTVIRSEDKHRWETEETQLFTDAKSALAEAKRRYQAFKAEYEASKPPGFKPTTYARDDDPYLQLLKSKGDQWIIRYSRGVALFWNFAEARWVPAHSNDVSADTQRPYETAQATFLEVKVPEQ